LPEFQNSVKASIQGIFRKKERPVFLEDYMNNLVNNRENLKAMINDKAFLLFTGLDGKCTTAKLYNFW
jgi:hypothetical protein